MESLAYIHNAIAYESDEPMPEAIALQLPSSAWIATSSILLSLLLTSGLDGSAIASVTGVVNTGGAPLNVRRSPNGEVVGEVENGSQLQLTGKAQGGWLEQADGTWVMARFIQSSPAAAPDQTAQAQPQTAYVRTNGASLNVRQSPNGAVVRQVDNGSQLSLTGRSDRGWLEQADGTWVSSQFVSPTPSNATGNAGTTSPTPTTDGNGDVATSPSPGNTESAGTSMGVVSTGGNDLNVRQSPGGEVVGRLQDGQQIQLTGREENGWLERADGTWVQAQFIQTNTAGTDGQTATSASPTPGESPTTQASPSPAESPTTQASPSPAGSPTTQASPSPTGSPTTQASPSPTGSPTAQASPSPNSGNTAQSTPAATPSNTQNQGGAASTAVVRTNGSPLNVRNSPGGRIVDSLPNGSRIELTGRTQNTWSELTSGNWVSSTWIETSSTTPDPEPPIGNPVQTAFVSTNGSPLNVRETPAGRVIGGLRNGSRVELTGRNSGVWAERTNGTWVSSDWLNYTETPPVEPPEGGDATTAFVSTNGSPLNVRRTPGGVVIGTLLNGSRIELTGRNSGVWAERTDGTWVSSDWISFTNNGNVGGPDVLAQVATNGSPLLVRSSPGGSVIGQFSNGTRITLNGRTSGAWQQLSSGGWVSGDWIVFLSR